MSSVPAPDQSVEDDIIIGRTALQGQMTDWAERYRTNNLSVIKEAQLIQLADYWQSLRQGDRLPSRQDINPLQIPWALPNLFVVDYDRHLGQYSYRLAGSEIEAVFENETGRTGMKFAGLQDMLPADNAALVRDRWKRLVEDADIIYMSGQVYRTYDRVVIGGRLLLPLSDNAGNSVTGLIGLTLCDRQGYDPTAGAPSLEIYYIPSRSQI